MTTESEKQTPADGERQVPRVFLSYASENKELAGQVANTLMENGIKVWWDEWEIRSGDSIRQKIDAGIEGCTHFLVLLTEQSIDKPWVKTEMDAAFVSKLKGKCKFIAVRHELAVDRLPPTLLGQLSPEIKSGTDVDGLISDIHEMNKRPPIGQPPAAVLQAQEVETGYSAAVTAMARAFVEQSKKIGSIINVTLSVNEIQEKTGLTLDDVEDAYHELKDNGFLKQGEELGWSVRNHSDSIEADKSLFKEFDRLFTEWDPEEDAKQIAVDMLNKNNFPTSPEAIAKHYGWKMRRAEPALLWLKGERLVKIHNALGQGIGFHVEPNRSALRRFVREEGLS